MGKNLRENIVNEKTPSRTLFKQGLISGIGWAFGVTIGFVLISTLMVFVLQQLGGLPLIGDWLASVVDATIAQLSTRTPTILPSNSL